MTVSEKKGKRFNIELQGKDKEIVDYVCNNVLFCTRRQLIMEYVMPLYNEALDLKEQNRGIIDENLLNERLEYFLAYSNHLTKNGRDISKYSGLIIQFFGWGEEYQDKIVEITIHDHIDKWYNICYRGATNPKLRGKLQLYLQNNDYLDSVDNYGLVLLEERKARDRVLEGYKKAKIRKKRKSKYNRMISVWRMFDKNKLLETWQHNQRQAVSLRGITIPIDVGHLPDILKYIGVRP